MQSLNDDMDELYRRAGEEYPLHTSGADWDNVMHKLHHAVEDLPEENKKKKDYRYLWLLLLLPLGFMIGRYIGNDKKAFISKANNHVHVSAASAGKTPAANAGLEMGSITTKEQNTSQGIKDVDNKKLVRSSNVNKTAGSLANSTSKSNDGVQEKVVKPSSVASSVKMETAVEGTKNKGKNALADKTSTKEPRENTSTINNPIKPAAITQEGVAAAKPTFAPMEATSTADTSKKVNLLPNKDVAAMAGKASKKNNQKPFKPTLSWSFVIGPDISTVKLQRTSTTGYSLGLLLGYQFSRTLSVEAGVLWDRKNYYTDGKYLDTSRLKLPMHSTVLNADGYCNMVEIPVNIRYDFKPRQNHSWFVSAGLSSYLMKQEQYDLNYERYNQPYFNYYGYKNSSKDWFSILNVSAGYQRSIGKSASMRIAPYIKLPLRGVGIGKLPISSTGIYISFSRSVH